MKAYIVTFTFEDILPTVWRKVIMPAGVTFNRVHEVIQHTTNFQSYMEPYHYFEFPITQEKLIITNNPYTIEAFKADKNAFHGNAIKQPAHNKIDAYIEKYGELVYCYDAGDDWRITIKLDEIVDDYYFGYPTLLDFAGDAPPEDVGGPPGFAAFLQAYNNPAHPEFLQTYAWAEKQHFRRFDPYWTNYMLKTIDYKKTEWSNINHINYIIQSDKYRQRNYFSIDEIENHEEIFNYIVACTALYGIVPQRIVIDVYNAHHKKPISLKELVFLCGDKDFKNRLQENFVRIKGSEFIYETIGHFVDYKKYKQAAEGKPFYMPSKEQLIKYMDGLYIERTPAIRKLEKQITQNYDINEEDLLDIIYEVVGSIQIDTPFNNTVEEFLNHFEFDSKASIDTYIALLVEVANTTRIWGNRGHTPSELASFRQHSYEQSRT
ncbi:plasmid pRiA4b ORF-3 family protein [Solibacillus sp. CAU 1738]|uniref:plasmid pRiA4b ORF-3 family protein n=1 Tax=Solibacillus sp. CAU 1738 TaxID=3140363 RepID=UPI003261159E